MWVPSKKSSSTDKMSKSIGHHDWRIAKIFFSIIKILWGPLTIDRFAYHENSQAIIFNSIFYCPYTKGVDAFSHDWLKEKNYMVPEVSLAPKTIKYMENCKCKGVLIVPYWPFAMFWPLLFETQDLCKPFVKGTRIFHNSLDFIEQGYNKNCFVGLNHFTSAKMALKIVFSLNVFKIYQLSSLLFKKKKKKKKKKKWQIANW